MLPFFRARARRDDGVRAAWQKEEKLHDEKITNANAKIKQAGAFLSLFLSVMAWCDVLNLGRTGQLYEKKVKKNSYDAVEEHARYMHLLTSIGPEVSQEK